VRRLVSQDVEFYSNALASAVEVALVERAQVIGSKMDRLKTVLEGRERLAKKPEMLKKQLDQPKKK
jgi:hypothetical protein